MNKEELEKAIENGESVWVVEDRGKTIYEIKLNKYSAYVRDNSFYANTMLPYQLDPHYICSIDKVKTKAEAEHYLHHSNITRTETLPFLTWEDFKNGKSLRFNDIRYYHELFNDSNKYIELTSDCKFSKRWELTEENFYKAYDECVKLFKGCEDE